MTLRFRYIVQRVIELPSVLPREKKTKSERKREEETALSENSFCGGDSRKIRENNVDSSHRGILQLSCRVSSSLPRKPNSYDSNRSVVH